jgi:uncharacterized protein GlcG (DUF336 family)
MGDGGDKTSISDDLAGRLIATAVAQAEGMGQAFSIAVCDESGVLKALHRMDGAALVAVQISQD